jgi:hypothetical protein
VSGQADAIKGAAKLATGVYKWARTTQVGRATSAAAVLGVAHAQQKKHGHSTLEHHAVEGATEHIGKPVVDNLIQFLRGRR